MTLQERLSVEIKAAMLAREPARLGALRMLKSAVGYVLIERKAGQLSDAEFMAVVQREVKKRRDAAEQFEKGGRPEMAANELLEITILEEFLPKAMPPEELEALIKAVIQEVGATSKKDMGAVMKVAQAKVAGRADGKTVSTLVQRLLP